MLLSESYCSGWKKIFNYFLPKNKSITFIQIDNLMRQVYNDINELWAHQQSLAQDQFAKSSLQEVSRLEGRIQTVLMEWEEIIASIETRIQSLENAKQKKTSKPKKQKKG